MNQDLRNKHLLLLFFFFLSPKAIWPQSAYADSIKKVIGASRNDTVVLKSLYRLAGHYRDRKDTTLAGIYLEQLKRKSDSLGNTYGLISYYNEKANLSLLYSFYPKALEYYLAEEKLLLSHPDDKVLASVYNNLGVLYIKKADYSNAISYFHRALKLYEKLRDDRQVANCLNNIGVIYFDLKDYDNAFEYFRKSLNILEKLGLKSEIASTLDNVAGIFAMKKNYNTSLAYLHRAIRMNNEAGDSAALYNDYSNMGAIYSEINQPDSALKFFNISLNYRLREKDIFGMAQEYMNIGSNYLKMEKYSLAENYFHQCLKLANELSANELIMSTTGELAKVYHGMKDYRKAFEYHVKFKQLSDSIFNSQNFKQISDIKTQYAVEKREMELKALHQADQIKNEEELRQQKIVRNYSFAGGIALLLLTFLIYRNLRLSRNSNKTIRQQKVEVERQKDLVEEKQKEILDSIKYAKRIQNALLASKKLLDDHLPEYFIVFKPRDIVSGDFYWATSVVRSPETGVGRTAGGPVAENRTSSSALFYLAVCDSTGHGVPGAMMSMLNIACLNEALTNKIYLPSEILDHTRQRIIHSLALDGSQDGGKDGMDCTLCRFEFPSGSETGEIKLTYAAANNGFYILRKGQLIHCRPDKMPVGRSPRENVPFTLFETQLQKGDLIYLLSDGYSDQFGGSKGKKFKYKQLEEMFVQAGTLPLGEQEELFSKKFEDWKGRLEQVDDVCIIGIKI
jgi:serine phosphatase RsbU (regulator of sigma subunit)